MRFPPPVRAALDPAKIPWTFAAVALAATAVQLNGSWRGLLIYDRAAVGNGEWWRLWTGNLVHFGWPHFVADGGLFLILGRLLEWQHPRLCRLALVAMPLIISGSLFLVDPGMTHYAGLSAVNLGLLVFLACNGWQKNWVDWFWPTVLAIYVAEVILEATLSGGHGGGMIQFDDPGIQVATVAHIPGAVFGVFLWLAARKWSPASNHRLLADSAEG